MCNRCDKCGQEVSMNNDVSLFDSIRLEDPKVMINFRARHLLPIVIKDGEVACEGSPSRYKYLPGYTTATAFFFEAPKMIRFRAAYRKMQREAMLLEAKQQEQES